MYTFGTNERDAGGDALCLAVDGVSGGSEALELLDDGTVLITSGLKYHGVTNSPEGGRIFAFDLNQFAHILRLVTFLICLY